LICGPYKQTLNGRRKAAAAQRGRNRATMANQKKTKRNKAFADRRTMNPPQGGGGHPAVQPEGRPGNQPQDVKRRQGSFEGAGEHARTGNPGPQ